MNNEITVKRLQTAAEVAQLVRYPDRTPDPMMDCDYGQYLQWLSKTIPENPDTMACFSAARGDQIVGYIVVIHCVIPPVYRYGTVQRISTRDTHALEALAQAAREWGRAKGCKRLMVTTYEERAAELYRRKFGLRRVAWQLEGEV